MAATTLSAHRTSELPICVVAVAYRVCVELNTRVTQTLSLDDAVAGCALSHQRLLGWLDELDVLDGVDVALPSLLPGWTVGHVLTHLARNADGSRRMLEAAAVGEERPMYPSSDHRTAGIDAGASRPFAAQLRDIRTSIWALESCWAGLDAPGWSGFGLHVTGRIPVATIPLRRWREIEIHWIDLGLSHTWRDMSGELVAADLQTRRDKCPLDVPRSVVDLGERGELCWLYGRSPGSDVPEPPVWF